MTRPDASVGTKDRLQVMWVRTDNRLTRQIFTRCRNRLRIVAGLVPVLQSAGRPFFAVMAVFGLVACLPAWGAQDESSGNALAQTTGTPSPTGDTTKAGTRLLLSGSGRMLFVRVRQDGFDNPARSLTFRLRTALEAIIAPDLSLLAEFEGGFDALDRANDLVGAVEPFPVVPDPDFAQLNRLQLDARLADGLGLTLGRQRLALDDERFLGAFDFRQNTQSFDAVRLSAAPHDRLTIDLAYFGRVNRILPNRSDLGTFEGDSLAANVSVRTPLGQLGGFYYGFELDTGPDEARVQTASNETVGVRYTGRFDRNPFSLAWTASHARQQDFAENPVTYRAKYWLGDIEGRWDRLSVGLRYEELGADAGAGVGFQTPVGTLHKFQGAADIFLVTPPEGLRERSVRAVYRVGQIGPVRKVRFDVAFQDYAATTVDRHYGTEIDLGLRAAFRGIAFALDYATYNADDFAVDTRGWFFSVSRKF